MSAENIEELIQCSLCLEVLHNPKMLACQHTFCMACLSVYIAGKCNNVQYNVMYNVQYNLLTFGKSKHQKKAMDVEFIYLLGITVR